MTTTPKQTITPKHTTKLEVTEVKCQDDTKESERVQIFGSGFGATINLISTAIGGGGMFGNIFGASQLGIFGFVLITFLSALFTYLSIQFLVISSNISNKLSCYELSEKYLGGKKGNILTKIFIIFGNWTFVINVIQIFADFVSNILPIILHISDTNSFWVSREFAVMLGLLFIFPWVQSKTIKSLEQLSGIFVLLCIVILLIIIVNAFKASLLNSVSPNIQLGPSTFEGFFHGLPAITWCWTIQFNVLPVYNTLNMNGHTNIDTNKSLTMSHVGYWTVISLFLYYVIFGFAALIIWGNKINPDFMTNLDYNDINYVFYYGIELSTTTQCIMCIITFASIPMFAFEARTNTHYIMMDIYYNYIKPKISSFKLTHQQIYDNNSITDYMHIERAESEANIDHELTPLIGSDPSNSNSARSRSTSLSSNEGNKSDQSVIRCETWISRLIESGIIITTAAIVALYLTNLNWCLSLVGATYGCYIAYFVPSIVYWKSISNKINKELSNKLLILKFMAIVSILYGIIVCVLGVTMAFI